MQPMESNHSSLQQLDCISLTKKQKSLITMVVIVSILEFFDLFLIGFIVAILIQDKNWILTSAEISFILAAGGIGTVIGAILCGYLADKYGRKKSFILCIMIVVTFTGFSALTPVNNWIFLFLMRFFPGVGVGGLNIIAIPYLQEFMPTKQRGFFTGLASAFVPIGLLLGSVATRYLYDSLGWRGLLLVGCIPVFLLPWIRSMPESPRYLVLKGHFEEAKKAYAWAMNISTNEVGNLPKYAIHSTVSYMKIIRDNLKPLFIVSLGTFCFTFGSFIIQSWGQTLLSKCFNFSVTEVANLFIIISLGDLIGRLLSAYSSDYIGRRWTLFIFGSMGAIGCMIATFSLSYSTILFTPFLNSLSPAWFFLTGILVVMMFGDGAFGIINVFGGEMFSNEIRSTCLGLGYGMGATAKIIGPVFFGYLNDGIKLDSDGLFIPFLILGFVFLLGSIIYLFAKETKNIQLEEL